MSFNLLEAVKTYLTPELISKAGSFLGENETSVAKAITGIVPTVLGGLISRAESSTTGASEVFDITKTAFNSGTTGNFADITSVGSGMNKSAGFLPAIFGNKFDGITAAIASFAGIKTASATSLFSMAGPLVAGLIGRHVSETNMSATNFSSFLSNQKLHLAGMLPAGLPASILSPLGIGNPGNSVPTIPKTTKTYGEITGDQTRSGTNWLLWLLVAVLAALAFWYFLGKGCNKQETSNQVVSTDTSTGKPVEKPAVSATGSLDSLGNFIYDIGNATEIKLADGTVLNVGEKGTEARLFKMLTDPSWSIDTIDKTKNWLVMDRVYFETGRSVLRATSAAQVKNIGTILKNFPKASIKLGGYTDNTGDASINKRISEERAKVVASELIKSGALASQVVEAVGYGPEFPVCPANDTPECKAQNRRVDLKVASK